MVVAYNQHERRKKFKHQPGGTVVAIGGNMVLRANVTHIDDRRMGQWSSQVYQGKNGLVTRVETGIER